MDCFGEEFQMYWETSMYLQTQELESCLEIEKDASMLLCYNKDDGGLLVNKTNKNYNSVVDESGYSDVTSKNIVNERKRRKQLNERLMALRAVVPNITKMDKATIITDAINYIKELKQQKQKIEADIRQLEQRKLHNNNADYWSLSSAIVSEQSFLDLLMESRNDTNSSDKCSQSSLIDDLNIRVSYAGKRTLIVSLTCANRKGVMTKMCECFEGLKLNIITTHISAFNGTIIKTVYIVADEHEKDYLREKIEMVISSSSSLCI